MLPVAEGLLEPFAQGLGYQDLIAVTTPAAGANAPTAVEGRNWIRVLGGICTVATDANAANRVLSLDFLNARSQTLIRNFPPLVITANTTATVFHWQWGLGQSEWATNTPVRVPLRPLFLAPASIIQFTLDNKQVGDALTALSLLVERFDTGPGGYPIGFVANPPESVREAQPDTELGPKPPPETPPPPLFGQ